MPKHAQHHAPDPPTSTRVARPPELPGQREPLPKGALSKPFFAPQGDENRDPPANAPAQPPLLHDPVKPNR